MILDLMVEEERVILDFEFHMRKKRERERESYYNCIMLTQKYINSETSHVQSM